jgi:hypothetical protein
MKKWNVRLASRESSDIHADEVQVENGALCFYRILDDRKTPIAILASGTWLACLLLDDNDNPVADE